MLDAFVTDSRLILPVWWINTDLAEIIAMARYGVISPKGSSEPDPVLKCVALPALVMFAAWGQ